MAFVIYMMGFMRYKKTAGHPGRQIAHLVKNDHTHVLSVFLGSGNAVNE